jgi:hypothetical protein
VLSTLSGDEKYEWAQHEARGLPTGVCCAEEIEPGSGKEQTEKAGLNKKKLKKMMAALNKPGSNHMAQNSHT